MIYKFQKWSGDWTDLDVAALGITPGPIEEKHLQEYFFTFRQLSLYDQQSFPHNTAIRIRATGRDDAIEKTIFVGTIVDADRTIEAGEEGINYRCESWWYALTMATLKLNNVPRVIYNARTDDPQYDESRYQKTVGQIIQDAATLVQAEITAYTEAKFHTAWPGVSIDSSLDVIPQKTIFDGANLQTVIKELLKFEPDAYLRINRETGRLHIQCRADTTTHNVTLQDWNLPANVTPITGAKIKPRIDLVIPQIILKFPDRKEQIECYIDHTLTVGTPDELLNIPETIVKKTDFEFQLSHRPVYQLIEVVGAGQFTFSQVSGIITFKQHPANFWVRYISEETQVTFDTGQGGTGFTDYGIDRPILEKYLYDFPKVTRKFTLLGKDNTTPTWLLSPQFGQTFPASEMWPNLIGKTVSIAGRGSSTIAEIAIHDFTYTGLEATTIGALIGIPGSPLVVRGIGIRLEAAISGATRGDFLDIVVEDYTAAVSAVADAFWKANRDVHWSGDVPALRWMPELELSHRVNLLGTNDAKMATMAETILQLSLDFEQEETGISLGLSPWTDLDTLLGLIKDKFSPQNFLPPPPPMGGGGAMQTHKHDGTSANQGGDELKPNKMIMNGGSSDGDDQFVFGVKQLKIDNTGMLVGDPTANFIRLSWGNTPGFPFLQFHVENKDLYIGTDNSGKLQIKLDGIDYIDADGSGSKFLTSKIRG